VGNQIVTCWFIPRPDLGHLLDAPPEVLQVRKQEVLLKETARQRAAYLKLLRGLPEGYVLNATKPLSFAVAEVEKVILSYVVRSTARRLALRSRK